MIHHPKSLAWRRLAMLAVALALVLTAFAFQATSVAKADQITVYNGNNTGPGSLRVELAKIKNDFYGAGPHTVVFDDSVTQVNLTSGPIFLWNAGVNPIDGLVIDGGGDVTIDSDGDQAFIILGTDVTFKDITIQQGDTPPLESSLPSATGLARPAAFLGDYPIDYGGCLLILATNLTLDGATVQNCLANAGGGIYTYLSDLTLDNGSVVQGNVASLGGGVFSQLSRLTVDNSNVDDNFAYDDNEDPGSPAYGGGIFGCFADVAVHNSSVSRNLAWTNNDYSLPFILSGSGGGIAMYGAVLPGGDGDNPIRDWCQFAPPRLQLPTTVNGLSVPEVNAPAEEPEFALNQLTVEDSLINNNEANGAGSGIWLCNADGDVAHSQVNANNSQNLYDEPPILGGGIYAGSSIGTLLFLSDGEFPSELAYYLSPLDCSGDMYGYVADDLVGPFAQAQAQGGGILDFFTSRLDVRDGSQINDNFAYAGGGVFGFGAVVKFDQTTIDANEALLGGGVMTMVGGSDYQYSTVSNNFAFLGGGIASFNLLSYFLGGDVAFGGRESKLAPNAQVFDLPPGYVYSELVNTTVSNNEAYLGAGYLNLGATTVHNATITENYAEMYGGGYLGWGPAIFGDTILAGNEAGFIPDGQPGNLGNLPGGLSTPSTVQGLAGLGDDQSPIAFLFPKELYGPGYLLDQLDQPAALDALPLAPAEVSDVPTSDCLDVGSSFDIVPWLYALPEVMLSDGFNIIGNLEGCDVAAAPAKPAAGFVNLDFMPQASDQVGVDPELKPLANNGGPTQTHAITKDGPAYNMGNDTGCFRYDYNAVGGSYDGPFQDVSLNDDQRGEDRPALGRCDVGAYELQGPGEGEEAWSIEVQPISIVDDVISWTVEVCNLASFANSGKVRIDVDSNQLPVSTNPVGLLDTQTFWVDIDPLAPDACTVIATVTKVATTASLIPDSVHAKLAASRVKEAQAQTPGTYCISGSIADVGDRDCIAQGISFPTTLPATGGSPLAQMPVALWVALTIAAIVGAGAVVLKFGKRAA